MQHLQHELSRPAGFCPSADSHQPAATAVASPMLAQTCAAGKAIPKAKLEFMRADGQGEPIKYFEDSACYLAPTLRREL